MDRVSCNLHPLAMVIRYLHAAQFDARPLSLRTGSELHGQVMVVQSYAKIFPPHNMPTSGTSLQKIFRQGSVKNEVVYRLQCRNPYFLDQGNIMYDIFQSHFNRMPGMNGTVMILEVFIPKRDPGMKRRSVPRHPRSSRNQPYRGHKAKLQSYYE